MDPATALNAALTGRYTIEREIGRGGMATVYLARDIRHERDVALKVLNPELGAVLGSERFLSEIRVTANLQHPSLLPLFDSGEAGGLLFYVMPFVEGETLRARLDRCSSRRAPRIRCPPAHPRPTRRGDYDFLYGSSSERMTPLLSGADGTVLSTKTAGGCVGVLFAMYAYRAP